MFYARLDGAASSALAAPGALHTARYNVLQIHTSAPHTAATEPRHACLCRVLAAPRTPGLPTEAFGIHSDHTTIGRGSYLHTNTLATSMLDAPCMLPAPAS